MDAAQQTFEAMIRGPVADALHSLGLAGTHREFRIDAGQHRGTVRFQKSAKASTSKTVTYWVNLEVSDKGTKSARWQSPLRWLLPRGWDRLDYSVRVEDDPVGAAQGLIDDLRGYAHPALMVGLNEPDFEINRSDQLDPVTDASGQPISVATIFGGAWRKGGVDGWSERGLDWDIESPEGLIHLAANPSAHVRMYASWWLVRRHAEDDRVSPLLCRLAVDDPHSQVREMATSLLVFRRGDLGVQPIIDVAANDPSYSVRWWARYALLLDGR